MYKILIIEDEPAYQQILKNTFKKERLDAILASNGEEGIIEATKSLPDFILLDMIMPGMDGPTFLNHINSVKGLAQVPIAILTVLPEGLPQKLRNEEILATANIVGYWVKDTLTPKKIAQKVKDYLNNKPDKL